MTKDNEQIMIDDIDVSKCKYYKEYSNPNEDGDEYNDICECSITESAFCFDECNSNCYFKNWQRKEQECEKLRFPMKDNNYAILTKEEFENFNQLKKENEDLKRQLESTKGLAMLRYQCLEAIKELANNANLPNVGLYIDSFLNEEFEKYKDNEQQEKEMQKLYNKFNGNSLIEKSSPYGN